MLSPISRSPLSLLNERGVSVGDFPRLAVETDDSGRIGRAIAALSIGGILFFPPATYTGQNIQVPASVTVTGPGATLQMTASSTVPLLVATGDNVYIHDITLDGNKANQSYTRADTWASHSQSPLVLCDQHNGLKVQRCKIKNAYFDCVVTGGGSNHDIRDNNFDANVGNAILLYVNTNYTSNIPTQCIVTGNVITNCTNNVDATGAWGNGIIFSQGKDSNIYGNIIITVDRDSIKVENPVGGVCISDNYLDTAGFHNVAVQTIGTDVTIQGNRCYNATNSGVYCSGTTGYITGVHIQGNTIVNPGVSGNSTPHGITLQNVQESLVEGNKISNACTHGIYLDSTNSMTCNNLKISGNKIDTVGSQGICVLIGANNVEISRNRITNPSSYGIQLAGNSTADSWDNANIFIEGNTIKTAASSDAILVNCTASNLNSTVKNNIVNGNKIEVDANAVEVSGNTSDSDLIASGNVYGNGQNVGKFVSVPASGSFTPNPSQGSIFQSAALTNTLYFSNPTANRIVRGQEITFYLLQDSTGGRSVSFGTQYKTTYSNTNNVANAVCILTFFYDGTNFIEKHNSGWNTSL